MRLSDLHPQSQRSPQLLADGAKRIVMDTLTHPAAHNMSVGMVIIKRLGVLFRQKHVHRMKRQVMEVRQTLNILSVGEAI